MSKTWWERHVEEPRREAQTIMDHAYHGNWEAVLTCKMLNAQANSAEKVLKEFLEQNPGLAEKLGIPE